MKKELWFLLGILFFLFVFQKKKTMPKVTMTYASESEQNVSIFDPVFLPGH